MQKAHEPGDLVFVKELLVWVGWAHYFVTGPVIFLQCSNADPCFFTKILSSRGVGDTNNELFEKAIEATR